MNFLRGNTRRSLLETLSGTVPAAASFFGITIGRALVLRISALLALRTVVSSVELPLDSSVISYVWSFLFTLVQASFLVTATADFFNWGGILGFIIHRLFGWSNDSAFIALYGSLVLVIGPLCSFLEACVMTYELIRVSREAEDQMFKGQARGEGKLLERTILGASAFCAGLCGLIVYVAHQAYPGTVPVAMGSLVIVLYGWCLLSEDGHILETSLLALLSCLTLLVGLVEEFDCPTSMLDSVLLGEKGEKPVPRVMVFGKSFSLDSDEARAVTLIYTVIMLLYAMSRAPRFMRLARIGAHAFEEEEAVYASGAQLAGPIHNVGATVPGASTEGVADSNTTIRKSAALPPYEPRGLMKGMYSVLVQVAMTFRVLIWTREVRSSEYLPGLIRIAQVGAMVIFYRVFTSDGDEAPETQPVPEPVRDMAGNIIPNPVAI